MGCTFSPRVTKLNHTAHWQAFQKRLPDDWHDKLAFEDVMGTFHDTADRLLRLLSKHLTRDVLREAWCEGAFGVRPGWGNIGPLADVQGLPPPALP